MGLEELKTSKKAVGTRETLKVVEADRALKVFVAKDAEKQVVGSVLATCSQKGIEIVEVATMHELGIACSIQVGTATAALIK